MLAWLEEHWSKSTPFIALYLGIALVLFLLPEDYALFLIWMQIVVYLLHEFEEYILPGGFVPFFNHNILGSRQDYWPLNKKMSLWINIPIIYLAYPITAILATFYGYDFGLWLMYFSILNALGHVGMAARLKKYNPGFVVSLLGNIPFGIYSLWYLTAHGLTSVPAHIIGLTIALICQGVVMAFGFKFLKPPVKAQQH